MPFYAVCSNQKCDHWEDLAKLKENPVSKHCSRCGWPMVTECPKCGTELHWIPIYPDEPYCKGCGFDLFSSGDTGEPHMRQ